MDNNDQDHITKHPPETDIDQFIENCNFRIERMSEESVWLAAYTHDDGEVEHHYDIHVTDEGGLHIIHEESRDNI